MFSSLNIFYWIRIVAWIQLIVIVPVQELLPDRLHIVVIQRLSYFLLHWVCLTLKLILLLLVSIMWFILCFQVLTSFVSILLALFSSCRPRLADVFLAKCCWRIDKKVLWIFINAYKIHQVQLFYKTSHSKLNKTSKAKPSVSEAIGKAVFHNLCCLLIISFSFLFFVCWTLFVLSLWNHLWVSSHQIWIVEAATYSICACKQTN